MVSNINVNTKTLRFSFTDDEWDLVTWLLLPTNYGNLFFDNLISDTIEQKTKQRDVNDMEKRHKTFKLLSRDEKTQVLDLMNQLATKYQQPV